MHIVSTILLGVSSNLDNLFLGASLGLQGRRITLLQNILIGLLSAIFSFIFCLFATYLSDFGRIPNILGGLLIIFLGIRTFFSKEDASSEKSTCFSEKIPFSDALVLGIALAINCLALSFGAGLTGISPLSAMVAVGVGSIITVGTGNKLGLKAGLTVNNQKLNYFAGGFMILLGFFELLV